MSDLIAMKYSFTVLFVCKRVTLHANMKVFARANSQLFKLIK